MRVALIALMFGGAPCTALAFDASPQPDVRWMFASHKPLLQSVGSIASAGPVPDAEPVGGLPRQVLDDAPRQVAPVAAPALAEATPAPVPQAGFELAMRPSDGRVSQAVRRYAERHGWQLAWEIDRDFPIEYPATFRGDFLGVVEQIVRSLQNTDAPIRVKVYEANRVLRVVHATQ
ncbi:hypothetical protein UC34_25110 [Pandoraea vervacti]|uniref:Toxin co-regulated pilus biosynthesis protein Q C-terminal domain-containing protein n=2 Tax=Pandoraea vervacti TaxID=656178 RepID=A0ABM6FQM2_9BURK|nr:hypothetical protein UC34_25110 [Pandoraea vervacti]